MKLSGFTLFDAKLTLCKLLFLVNCAQHYCRFTYSLFTIHCTRAQLLLGHTLWVWSWSLLVSMTTKRHGVVHKQECTYWMLSSWPLTVPLSGNKHRDFEITFSCCFLSWSSLLCRKSVEAERGSPSLTRTTKANRISDMLLGGFYENTSWTQSRWKIQIIIKNNNYKHMSVACLMKRIFQMYRLWM